MKHNFKVRAFSFISLLSLLFGALGIPIQSVLGANGVTALQFNGNRQYVTFGNTTMNQGTLTVTPPCGGDKHSPVDGCDWEVFVVL